MMKKLTLILGVIIVGLVLFIMTIDLNNYKPKLEESVKNALGYDLKIDGDISLSFSPIGVSIADVSMAVPNKKAFVSFESFDVALEFMPLLKQELKVNYILLSKLDLNIIKMKNGKTNFELEKEKKPESSKPAPTTKEEEPAKLPLINVTQVRLEHANIHFTDEIFNTKADLKDVDIKINDISLDSTKQRLKSIALKGEVDIKQITYNKYNIYNTTLDFDLKDAIANLNSMRYTIFDSQATAKARVDMSSKELKVSLEKLIPNLKLENFSKEILKKDLLKGTINAKVNLTFTGDNELTAKKTAKGTILLDAQDIGIKGYDIDKIVKSYNTLKKGDLKETGASFLSSALENTAKGKDTFTTLKGGTTAVKQLHVKIDIANQTAHLNDVALSTPHNRVAIKGSINIVNETLKEVSIAILDKKGCASYSQSISGSLKKPNTQSLISADKVSAEQVQEAVSIISSLFGKKKEPKKEKKKCQVFYKGAVKHP